MYEKFHYNTTLKLVETRQGPCVYMRFPLAHGSHVELPV